MTTATVAAEPDFYHEKTRFKGIFGWIFSTDHKRIGILYLIAIITFFLAGMTIGVLMRLEMLNPENTIVTAQTYNMFFTLHGIIMIFLVLIPVFPAVFGNFFLPLMIGAKDVFFPRLNLLSWWLFMAGGTLALVSLFLLGGAADTGWTFYVPYSIRSNTNIIPALLAAFILGFSSILTGLNFITTIHRMRAPGMTWFKMPLFTWSLYATGWVQVLATPVIGITLLLVTIERLFGVGIFYPTLGGDPVLYQHLFWMYSHPAVYIIILPAMGVVSDIIPVFARRTIFGYKFIAYSSLAIASVGSLVWAHHMFTVGMSNTGMFLFSLLTFLVAIPSAIKVFNWTATLYKGSIELEVPLLFMLAFIVQFSIGGLTGLMLGALSVNIHVTDTYFVVGHFHYVMFGGTGFALFGALHYWFPKMFGRMYKKRPAFIGWLFMTVGFNVLYFPMLILGYMGMPRRYYHYLPEYEPLQRIATAGSWIMVIGILLLIANLIISLRKGKKAPANPWGGRTLEWTVASPPPTENFHEIPVVTTGPYDYSEYEKHSPGAIVTATVLEHSHRDDVGSRMGLWLFLFSELILFGGMFIIYAVYRFKHPEEFRLAAEELDPFIGTVNTIILLTSSLTVAMSITAIQEGKKNLSLTLVGMTLVFAAAFLVNKYFEWSHKISLGIYPQSPDLLNKPPGEILYFGLYYVMTGLHALHVIIGMIVLAVMFAFIAKGKINQHSFVRLEAGGLYWHLVDIIWIFLFPLFYLIQ